ncbi:UNVERIFIED_CONTAM: hypothetical protein K2H54_020770 [Gekko kuhli]
MASPLWLLVSRSCLTMMEEENGAHFFEGTEKLLERAFIITNAGLVCGEKSASMNININVPNVSSPIPLAGT